MKARLGAIAAVIVALFVLAKASSVAKNHGQVGDPGSFSSVLNTLGEKQNQAAENITEAAVSGVEDDMTGGHKEDGSNWSLPNIVAHWFE